MKNQYLVIRMSAVDIYDRTFLMRGFNMKRIEKVIGVIAVVGEGLLTSESKMYHLSRVNIDLLASDTQQSWGRLSWSSIDAKLIDSGMRRLPPELLDRIKAMRTNRIYYGVDTTIPEAFRDCHTELVYTPSAARKLVDRAEKLAALSEYSVEDIIAHLKTRIEGVTIAF